MPLYTRTRQATSACWLPDGRGFLTGHADGSLMRWPMKEGAAAPLQPNKDFEFCEAITRIRCLGAK